MTQTNPTQAAIDLCIALGIPDHHATTIQAAFAEREARWVGALEGLLDDDPCWHDHHGYCQAHFVTSPCEMAEARATLAALKDRTHG